MKSTTAPRARRVPAVARKVAALDQPPTDPVQDDVPAHAGASRPDFDAIGEQIEALASKVQKLFPSKSSEEVHLERIDQAIDGLAYVASLPKPSPRPKVLDSAPWRFSDFDEDKAWRAELLHDPALPAGKDRLVRVHECRREEISGDFVGAPLLRDRELRLTLENDRLSLENAQLNTRLQNANDQRKRAGDASMVRFGLEKLLRLVIPQAERDPSKIDTVSLLSLVVFVLEKSED